ncbi:MAG TPA: TonB family protein [Rhizomicrobium sp.]
MRIAILAAALAAVFAASAAEADDAPQPDSSGIVDLTNVANLPKGVKGPGQLTANFDGAGGFRTHQRLTMRDGRAVLTFVVKADGSVADARIAVSSGSADFDADLLDMMSHRYFGPAQLNGKPVAARVAMVVNIDTAARVASEDFTFTNPSGSFVSLLRGHNEDASGKHSEALADFDTLIKSDPQNADALRSRGFVHEELGQYDSAIQDETLALSAKPQYSVALMDRAFAYDALGKHDLAASDRKAVATMAPACAPMRIFDDAACHDAYAARIAALDKRIADNPNDFEAYARRCAERAIANAGLSTALADCNRVLDVAPDDATALAARGLVFYRMEIFPAALKDYDASLKRDPHSANSLYMRGIVETRMNNAAAGKTDILAARANDAAVASDMAFCGVYP